MTAYENDVLIIPKKYKKMSVSELKKEEQKLWKKIKSSKSRQKKKGKRHWICPVSCFLESFVASRKETVTLLLTSVARIMKH